MAKFINVAQVFVNQYLLGGRFRNVDLPLEREIVDVTAMTDTYRDKLASYRAGAWSGEAYTDMSVISGFNMALTDPTLFNTLASTETIVSIIPQGLSTGNAAYFFKSLSNQCTPLNGAAGEAAITRIAGDVDGRCIRGTVMINTTTPASTGTTSTGPATQLGSVAAGKYIYGALHIWSVVTPITSVVVKILSDDASNMTGASTRATFTTATNTNVQWMAAVAGSITDTWWQAKVTLTSTDNDATARVAVILGIQ